MNKPCVFKILYYICFIFSLFIWFGASNVVNIYGISISTPVNGILGIINLILVIMFSIKLIKQKLENINIIFPILHLVFSIIVIIISLLMNNKLMIPYMHYSYYMSFILFNYLLLNIYSLLSFSKEKKSIFRKRKV